MLLRHTSGPSSFADDKAVLCRGTQVRNETTGSSLINIPHQKPDKRYTVLLRVIHGLKNTPTLQDWELPVHLPGALCVARFGICSGARLKRESSVIADLWDHTAV